MARRRYLLLAFGLLLAYPSMAQQHPVPDSLEQEILAQPVRSAELLAKSRSLLFESLKAADTAKARKVLHYIEGKFNTQRTVALYPPERLLVDYWLNDYKGVLGFVHTVEAGEHVLERIGPDPDSFYDDMLDLSRTCEGRLRMDIRRSALAPHERDFALLLLIDVLGRDRGDDLQREAFQRKMNDLADTYLTSYANSEYNPFVRKHIRFVMMISEYGYGYGVTVGYLGLPSTLNRHLADYGELSFYVEGAYKMAYAYLGLDFGVAHDLKKGFEYNGTWPDGLSIMHMSLLFAVGPMFEPGGGFLAVPTIGISSMNFSTSETEKEKTGTDVSMSFAAWAIGASFRIPLGGENGSSFITVNAGYRKAMTSIEIAKGGYSFLTIGFGIFARPEVRDL